MTHEARALLELELTALKRQSDALYVRLRTDLGNPRIRARLAAIEGIRAALCGFPESMAD